MQIKIWLALCLMVECRCEDYPPLFEAMMRFATKALTRPHPEPPDTLIPKAEYDFIIVGAGSAGCTLANRLTEIEDWSVLLIEAGGPENVIMTIPLLSPFLKFTAANWGYDSEPSPFACKGLRGGRCPVPRGKVMGGSSVLNFMIYARGDRRDYDTWEALGNKGWSWAQVYPYFLKSEGMQNASFRFLADPRFHNQYGYQSVDTTPYKTKLVHSFVRAGQELGFKVGDYNGGDINGFSYVQSTTKDGSRMSTSRAFLHPIKKRKNLNVIKYATVTKLILNGDRAVGVEYVKRRQKRAVFARKEVILSAGAINSPQILMLSGIGPREDLAKFNIPLVRDLPVGQNLMDHPVIGNVIFTIDKPESINDESIVRADVLTDYLEHRRGPLTIIGGVEGVGFIDTLNPYGPNPFPDLEIEFIVSSPLSVQMINAYFGLNDETYNKVYKSNGTLHSYLMFMTVLRPKSRGSIKLKSKNPFEPPAIDLGFFKHPDDVQVLVRGVQWSRNISSTNAMKQFNPVLYDKRIPGCEHLPRGSNAYWECHARHITVTNYHQCGTCKMGPPNDPSAVVDPRLRVKGMRGLRVVDASVIPLIMSGHPNCVVIMIADKAADMIKEDWGRL